MKEEQIVIIEYLFGKKMWFEHSYSLERIRKSGSCCQQRAPQSEFPKTTSMMIRKVWWVFPRNFSIWKIFALQYDSAASFNNSQLINQLCKWLLPFESSCYYTCEHFIFPRLKHSQGQVHLLVRFFHAHNSQWCTSNKEVYLLRGLLNAL